MALRENKEQSTLRWRKLEALQKHYASFRVFLCDMMSEIGFIATDVQQDIGDYLQYGPQHIMVQAQRGEAKTTITAMFAVWCLIHDPKYRVLIVSAGGKTASEIATLVQRLMMTVDVLECLRPDATNGDRTSVEAFDVHYSLKGIDKSPSVACIGVFGNLPGKRADLLIADDIESPKNSTSAANRATLLTNSLEFTSICSRGRIVYLGTPQTSESIYNVLPGRGFVLRIWTGRYPTPAEMQNYGDTLAPLLRRRMENDPSLCFGGGILGDKGKPTDPVLLDEEALCQKEQQGNAYFKLNFMLDTSLSDRERYPLKLNQIVVLRGGSWTRLPDSVTRGFSEQQTKDYASAGVGYRLALPHAISDALSPPQGIHMQIDPAGGGANGDETGYAISAFHNGNVFILACGGVPGGYKTEQLEFLADLAVKYKPNVISVEKNMGHGAFVQVWLPILRKKWQGVIDEPFVTGQKETRIIGTLEPVMGRGSLIFMEDVLTSEDESLERYPVTDRVKYSLMHQISKLTRQKKCLAHDDRVDALEGTVRYWAAKLAIDQDEKAKQEQAAKLAAFMANPLGQRGMSLGGTVGGPNMFNRFRR